MEFKDVVYARKSVRQYESIPISQGDLTAILEAGIHAPSAVNFQPWYFVAIHSPGQMSKVLEIMGEVAQKNAANLRARFANHPEVAEETIRFIGTLGDAPVCVLAFQGKEQYTKSAETILQSVAAGIENMLLAATDLGIGSCWLTAPVEAGMGARLQAQFAPDKGPLAAIVTFGYAKKESSSPRRKEGRYIIL